MGKFIVMKIESLQDQLRLLKSEIEAAGKKDRPNGGLRKLKGALKGKGNFTEKELASAKISQKDIL